MKKVLFAIALCFGIVAAQADLFDIHLNGTPSDELGLISGMFESPTNNSPAQGGEAGVGIRYDNVTMQLNFNAAYGIFGYQPLTGDFTASHIHQGAVGVPGPVVINLSSIHTPVGPRGGYFNGTLALTPALETALFNNQLYVNIHSTAFPDGEIRAQLTPAAVPEPSIWVLSGLGIAAIVVMRRRP